jgi:uncharacterized protein
LRRVLFGFCLVLTGLLAVQGAQAEDKSARAWLGLMAGSAAASETVLAADLASLFPQGSATRILPMLGDAGAGNLAALLDNPSVDLALVSTDALSEAADKDKAVADKIELVARLSPQEIHLLARPGIGAVAELSGRPVNFGPAGSASAVAATALFKALGLKVDALDLDTAAAIERLKRGTIAACVIVGPKPSPEIGAIPVNAGIRLLPIAFGATLEPGYLPTRLDAADYPNLIRAGDEVATVATGMALLAASRRDPASRDRIDRFAAALFQRFAELQAQGHHPKWRDVNLAANLPGFKRTRAAESWLSAGGEARPKAMAASAGLAQLPVLPDNFLTSQEQQEALFRRFIEWRRTKDR